MARVCVAGGVLAALSACTEITIVQHDHDDQAGDGETTGGPGTACPPDGSGADTSMPPGDAQPDSHVNPDADGIDASDEDVADAWCNHADASSDATTDAESPYDAGRDASDASDASDAGPSDAGSDASVVVDASSDVTCTFTRYHTRSVPACDSCLLPPEVTFSVIHTPMWLGYGGGVQGQGDLPPEPPPPIPPKRVIHVEAPSVFDAFWEYGNAFRLSGSLGNESWIPSGFTIILNGGMSGAIEVGSNNVVTISLSGQHAPWTSGCMIRGCYIETLSCSGVGVGVEH